MFNQPNKKLLNGCCSILQEYSNKIHHNISLRGTGEYYGLNCNQALSVKHSNIVYNVATFKDLENLAFNFSLKFDTFLHSSKKIEYNLTDANLRIFYLNDNRSQLLFRAEFSTNKVNQQHAQPHWQFEPYITKAIKNEDFDAILELRDEEVEITDFEQGYSKSPNISKIHFAMTSDWHKRYPQVGSCIVRIDEDNVVYWLDGCLKYLKSQIVMI